MALNKDGLEPGKHVEFETLTRIERQRAKQPEKSSDDAKPRRRGKTRTETAGDE